MRTFQHRRRMLLPVAPRARENFLNFPFCSFHMNHRRKAHAPTTKIDLLYVHFKISVDGNFQPLPYACCECTPHQYDLIKRMLWKFEIVEEKRRKKKLRKIERNLCCYCCCCCLSAKKGIFSGEAQKKQHLVLLTSKKSFISFLWVEKNWKICEKLS